MNLLILGNSSLIRRRVLPAILATKEFHQIDLATRRPLEAFDLPIERKGKIFSDYSQALKETLAKWVYISTTNQEHHQWAREALQSGRHVIVDKPAFTDLAAAEELTNLAEQKNLNLVEATVYTYHPQIQKLRGFFSEKNSTCSRLFAQFSVPPFKDDNFRYRKDLGGGSLMDLGPYATSIGRIFFNEEPLDVECRVLSKRNDVDTAFSLLLTYSQGRSLVGQFGFDTEYSNHIRVLDSHLCAWGDRIFTINADQAQTLHVKSGMQETQISVAAADSFAEFFKAVASASAEQSAEFKKDLLWDARLLNRMVQSTKKGVL